MNDRHLLAIPVFALLLWLMAQSLGWLPYGGIIPGGPV